MTSDLPDDTPTGNDAVRSTTRLFLGQVFAVAAIATVLTGFGVLVKGDGTAGTQTADPTATAAAPGTAEPGTTTAPAAPSETATAPSEAATPPSETPAPATTLAEDRPFVDVLNQSAGKGGAAAVADQIEVTGWRIGRVDNFVGNVRTTTIYFFPGLRKHARALEGTLPGQQRILPGFSNLVEDRLSIILVEPLPAD